MDRNGAHVTFTGRARLVRRWLLGAVAFTILGTFISSPARAATCIDIDMDQRYEVAAGTGLDHSASTGATIQACLDQAVVNGKLGVDLVSYSYSVSNTLTVHDGLDLRNESSSWQTGGKIVASSSFPTTASLVVLGDNTLLYKLELNGNHRAQHIINAGSTTNARIRLNAIHKTSLTGNRSFHLIVALESTDITIEANLMRRAGVSGPVNPTASPGALASAAIYAGRSTDAYINANNIAYTLSAGIDFTGSTGTVVTNNLIDFTGLGAVFDPKLPSADGITSYHNLQGNTNRNIVVTGNTVTRWHNNGIHVTGRGLQIDNNRVDGGECTITGAGNCGRTILFSDWRPSPKDCTYEVSLQNNEIGRDSHGSYVVFASDHKSHAPGAIPSAIWPTLNTEYGTGDPLTNGDFTVWEGTPHC